MQPISHSRALQVLDLAHQGCKSDPSGVRFRKSPSAFSPSRTHHAGDPLGLANTVRQIVHQVGPWVPLADMTTQSRRIDQTILQERTFAQLCACFGVLALLMACVGLYETMAYAVARRTGEIGIRMALGATRRRVVWMVLREVAVLSAFGLLIGVGAAYQTTTFLKSFLFCVKPNDPLAMGASVAVLIACALLAGYLPAFRASRIDPMVALRNE